MDAVDPTVEQDGSKLREVIEWCVEWGRVRIPKHTWDRMDERDVSVAEIFSALRSGALNTNERVAGTWRYHASKEDLDVCFTFDVDDQGNALIIVTVIRRDEHEVHRVREAR